MDEKVLKWVAGAFGMLTLIVCISLYYFPDLQDKYLWVEAAALLDKIPSGTERETVEEARNESTEVGYPDLGKQNSDEDGILGKETDPEAKAQLVIDIPEGVRSQEITVENDFWNLIIYIKFPGAGEEYIPDYQIKGSSDRIKEINYSTQGEDGILALEVDRIYAVTQESDKEELYLNLLEPKEFYDTVVVVDAGHGGEMPGTVHDGIYEKDIDLAIVLELKKLFDDSDQNIGVFYTRLDDTNPSLEDRVALANTLQADLFISIHNNSVSKNADQLHGTQVLYQAADDSELNSRGFAQICLDHVIGALDSQDVGLIKGDSVLIVGKSEVPVALIEVGFMSNQEELEKLCSQEYQAKAAQGIYEAVLEAIEKGY